MPGIRRDRAEWEQIIGELESSGERQGEFARKRGLSIYSLRDWLYRIRRERQSARSNTQLRLLPIHVQPIEASPPAASRQGTGTGIEVWVAEIAVRAWVGTSPQYLAQVISELRRRC